jgi:hypothetical protein
MSAIPGLPSIEFPSDMKAAIVQLQQSAKATDDSVRACATLDQPTRASWGVFYIGLVDFTTSNANPSVLDMTGGLVQRANSYQQQLYAWQQKIAKVCPLTLPPLPPKPKPDPTPGEKAADAVIGVLKWGSIFAGIVGGAFIVGKGLALLPAPSPRK